jgi:hypothetical protein
MTYTIIAVVVLVVVVLFVVISRRSSGGQTEKPTSLPAPLTVLQPVRVRADVPTASAKSIITSFLNISVSFAVFGVYPTALAVWGYATSGFRGQARKRV